MKDLPPRLRRIAERLQNLVDEGRAVAKLPKGGHIDPYIQGSDKATAEAWLTKTENILRMSFGAQSAHLRRFGEAAKGEVSRDYQVYTIVGIIEAALDDLQNGYLTAQEFLIAAELFDSLLDQAKHLSSAGYKDPAAVLGRVVLEDALRRIAQAEGMNSDGKASTLNDELKKAGRFPQPLWRQVQSWLDLGNAAAHGKFTSYSAEDVVRLLDNLEWFLASEFHT